MLSLLGGSARGSIAAAAVRAGGPPIRQRACAIVVFGGRARLQLQLQQRRRLGKKIVDVRHAAQRIVRSEVVAHLEVDVQRVPVW